jgi:multimeric flavodoxin WrbA
MGQAGRLWREGRLADKDATAFTASMTPHGGQESTILALNNTLYHWGMVVIPLDAATLYSWMSPPSRFLRRMPCVRGVVATMRVGCAGSGGMRLSARCGLWRL